MSQLEYIEDYSDAETPADTGSVLLTSMLVCSAVFMTIGIVVMLSLLGKHFQIGMEMFHPKTTSGSIAAVSDDGLYVTFRGPQADLVLLGDVFTVYRDKDYVGKVVVEKHPTAKVDDLDMQALTAAWGITINSDEYVGRVLLDVTVSDPSGKPDIRTEDKVINVRPLGLRSGAAK